MGVMRNIGTPRLVTLAGALGVVALLLGWSFGTSMRVDAQTPHAGLNFTITAEGESGCDTSEGDAVCYIDPGTEFVLSVELGDLPSDIPSYEAFDIVINYTGLTSADDATTESWPDCGFPASFFEAGKVAMSCAIGIPPAEPSTYTGVLGTNTFTCDESGTITLANVGMGNTNLLQGIGFQFAEAADETLDITCGDEPTPTNTAAPPTVALPTALAPTGTAGVDQDGGTGTGVWLAIAALAIIAVAGMSAFGWRSARSVR